MLAPRHAAYVRRARVFAWVVLAALLALVPISGFVIYQWPSTWVGVLMIIVGVIPIARGAASWMRVDSLRLVFDRSVKSSDDIPHQELERLRMRLTQQLAEVDAELIGLGVEPLETYLELRLAPDIARHDPATARASLERLLATRGARFDETTRRALEQLAQALTVAAEQGARFCLMPISGWSGLIETNLRLYYGR